VAVAFEQDIANGRNPRPILAIVFYHGRTKFSWPTSFKDYFKVSADLKNYPLDFNPTLSKKYNFWIKLG